MNGTKLVKRMLPSPRQMGCRWNVCGTGAVGNEMEAVAKTNISESQQDY